MSTQTSSIFSSLPTLKCAYQPVHATIKEEQPYIAMEELAGDNHPQGTRGHYNIYNERTSHYQTYSSSNKEKHNRGQCCCMSWLF